MNPYHFGLFVTLFVSYPKREATESKHLAALRLVTLIWDRSGPAQQSWGFPARHGGTPIAGWFMVTNANTAPMIWGSPISGNLI